MSEFYKFVSDEDELRWFFDHVVQKPELNENYMMCLSARNKKLDEQERLAYQLGRGEMMREFVIEPKDSDAFVEQNLFQAFKTFLNVRKKYKQHISSMLLEDDDDYNVTTEVLAPRSKSKLWDFNIFKSAVYRYECRKEGMVTKNGLPYPDKCLVVYFYPNPSKESLVVGDTLKLSITMLLEMVNAGEKKSWGGVEDGLDKLGTVSKHMKSSHATNLSRKLYVQFDFDFPADLKENKDAIDEAQRVLHTVGLRHFGKGNFVMVRTQGGFHILVKKASFSKAMEAANKKRKEEKLKEMPDYIYDVVNETSFEYEEAVKCKQEFLPLPGTYQYGKFLVTVTNKEDF